MKKVKERTTINFDNDVYWNVLKLRSNPEYAKMSVSALVNKLLAIALNEISKVKKG